MIFSEIWARSWTALVLAGLGLAQLLFPEQFFCAGAFFRRGFCKLSPEQAARLRRVLEARSDAEGVSPNPTRYTGLLGIAMAAMEFVPGFPFVIPYAIYCLAAALGLLSSYLHLQRATERRAAPLVPRSPFDALPPVLVAALVACFLGVAIYAAYPPFRLSAIAVAVSMLLFGWIAWRIAGSQALMFGDDPQLEYAVDERLRVTRANGTAALACAPAVVLVGLSLSWIDPSFHLFGRVALLLTYASFGVATLVSGLAMRRLSKKLAIGATA